MFKRSFEVLKRRQNGFILKREIDWSHVTFFTTHTHTQSVFIDSKCSFDKIVAKSKKVAKV